MRRSQIWLALALAITLTACGSSSSPTTPTAPTTPARTTFNLTGGVIDSKVSTNKVQNALLTITTGSNAGMSTTADGAGNFKFSNLTPGTFTITLHAANYLDGSQSVTLGNSDTNVNLFMDPVPPPIFVQSDAGDSVFTLPSYVTRVRVDATYGGSCQNFIVHVSTQAISLINIIIGTCGVADTRSPFSGTYAINNGGTVQITNSTGIAWTFTELR